MVRLQEAHDRNSGVLYEKTFELKSNYAEHAPRNLAKMTKALEKAAGVNAITEQG